MKILIVIFSIIPALVFAQSYKSYHSEITFLSEATLEDIAAHNKGGSGIINASSEKFAFLVPIKDFQFEKSLMQEHFNEKYMESDKFPRAIFTGEMEGYDSKLDDQQVVAKGSMKIHGVTREVEIPAKIEKRGDELVVSAKFQVKLEDYDIEIPKLLWQNIADIVDVNVEFQLKEQ